MIASTSGGVQSFFLNFFAISYGMNIVTQGILDAGGILVLAIPMLIEILFNSPIEVCVVINHYCGIDFVE